MSIQIPTFFWKLIQTLITFVSYGCEIWLNEFPDESSKFRPFIWTCVRPIKRDKNLYSDCLLIINNMAINLKGKRIEQMSTYLRTYIRKPFSWQTVKYDWLFSTFFIKEEAAAKFVSIFLAPVVGGMPHRTGMGTLLRTIIFFILSSKFGKFSLIFKKKLCYNLQHKSNQIQIGCFFLLHN